MPVDEKFRDAVLEAASLAYGGESIAVQQTPDRVFMRAGEHAVVISTGETPGLTEGDLIVLVSLCDRALAEDDPSSAAIKAVRAKLRARL